MYLFLHCHGDSMSKTIKVGVVGTSWFADLFHLPNLDSHPQATITAICGRNQEKAKEMADKYQIPLVFSDYQTMISEAEIEALVIITPDYLHYPITMSAIKANLHVYCEKPLSMTSRQAVEMWEAADQAKVKHMVGFSWRCVPIIEKMYELVKDGYIGNCFEGHFHYRGGYGRSSEGSWKWNRNYGLGILGDLGSHMIDMARSMVGEVSQVNAMLSNYVSRVEEDGSKQQPNNDSAFLMLKFENGAQVSIQASAIADIGNRGQEQEFILHGSNGTLEYKFNMKDGYQLQGLQSGVEEFNQIEIPAEIWEGIDRTQGIIGEITQLSQSRSINTRRFIDAIRQDLEIEPSFYDGMKVQKIIDAALQSDQKGETVNISD